MSETLPLFPLGTVLFPGLVLPLHVFEDRYRQLVHDLLGQPEPRTFGVVAIREGRETGSDGVSELHQVGCAAEVRRVTPHEDGRFDLSAVGTRRFQLLALDRSRPYLQAQAEFLPDEAGDEDAARAEAEAVRNAFLGYLDALATEGEVRVKAPELPREPVLLSYLVAASMILDLPHKQALLAEPDAAARLAAERALLAREISMTRTLTATPAPDLRNAPYNPN